MKASLLAIPIVLSSFWSVPTTAAPTTRTTRPAEKDTRKLTTLRSEGLGLELSYPLRWVPYETKAGDGAQGSGFTAIRLEWSDGKEDLFAIFSILRKEEVLKGVDPVQHVSAEVATHRAAARKKGVKVLSERDCAVGGVPGRAIELEVSLKDVKGQPDAPVMRYLFLVVVRDNREYKLTWGGQKDSYEAGKADAMKVIESIRWVPTKAKE